MRQVPPRGPQKPEPIKCDLPQAVSEYDAQAAIRIAQSTLDSTVLDRLYLEAIVLHDHKKRYEDASAQEKDRALSYLILQSPTIPPSQHGVYKKLTLEQYREETISWIKSASPDRQRTILCPVKLFNLDGWTLPY